jgi:Fic family protein
MFYISAFFEANREEYCERLLAISRDRDWTEWCAFFLTALTNQAKENQQKTSAILKLYENKKKQIHEAFRSLYTTQALDLIFQSPIFKTSDLIKKAAISSPAAKRIISELRKARIIKMLREGKGRRSAIYVFAELLNIAEGETIF